MELSEVWQWYCEQHIPLIAKPGFIDLSLDEVMQDFWTFHPPFAGRTDAIKATVVSRMWWKLPNSGLRACNVGSSQAARSRDIGTRG